MDVGLVNGFSGITNGTGALTGARINSDDSKFSDFIKGQYTFSIGVLTFNNNPIIVSAAIDLVKYAVQVEGLRMSATAINKVIDNDCLINSFGQNGLGFIDVIKAVMSDIKSSKGIYSSIDTVEQLYENYLRSHPNFKGIRRKEYSRQNINYKLFEF